ncbi:type II toxin-antitoxin system RelE/ParE family toxin [Magnetovirga frankeli]|uniref:type II toxin-antitoxin system RelE/ParE family toxin n=1 Tax=Magnetovirga frankeli TaxID=947516 RepID=UPI001AF2601D|nr:type II toxin-antitoxin system RelE/ParE family toxin [gamma proteobacterium SS-5]
MRIRFSPEAAAEFRDAENYYEQQMPGLGARFRLEVRDALVRLRYWPLAAPIERGEIRRLLLSRFPYKLLYSIEANHAYVIALAHFHRRPDYWIERSQQGVS